MANGLSVVRIFAVSLECPISFLVERGIENAVATLTTAHKLPKVEVFEWVAKALSNLLYIEMLEIEQTPRADCKRPMEVKYFSRNSRALVHFVDFGAAGFVTHLTTAVMADRVVIGSFSSRPGRHPAAATRKTSHTSRAALAHAERALRLKIIQAIEQAMWKVDNLILEGVSHVLSELEEVEGPMIVTFPKLIPQLVRLEAHYLAKAKDEGEK
ncbi:hypothetical protein LTR08_003732 [Meristemomyces frigidus]|nr:hypothetical protein LTR08_003732 [Meristemomyces frigidus]